MSLSPDRRLPCGKTSNLTQYHWLGGCLQQGNSDNDVPVIYTNVTRVPDYANPPSANGVVPYARKHNNGIGLGCWPDYTCGDGVNGLPYCELPNMNESFTTEANTVSIKQQGYTNYFKPTSSSSLSSCANVAWKAVAAKSAWFGRKGYVNNDTVQTSVDWCGACGYTNEQKTPDTIHYLAASASIQVSATTDIAGTPTNFTAYAGHVIHVDKETGRLLNDTCRSGSSLADADLNARWAAEIFATIGGYNEYPTLNANSDAGNIGTVVSNIIASALPALPTTITTLGTNHYKIVYTNSGVDTLEINIDYNTPKLIVITRDEFTGLQSSYTSYEYSVTSFFFYHEGTFKSMSVVGYGTMSMTAALSSPFNESESRSTNTKLLDEWDLTDDVQYPWRTDDEVQIMPLVTKYASTDSPTSLGLAPCCTTNTSSLPYTGEVLGKPMPRGYDKYWNPLQKNWETCVDLGTLETIWYVDSYGAWSTQCHVPAATQWTDKSDARFMPQGPFFSYNYFLADGYIWTVKYAETTNWNRPSVNFARPCGYQDRYALSSSACISYTTDNVLTLMDIFPHASGKVLVWGNGAWDGLWDFTGDGYYNVTLNKLAVSSSQIPSLYENGDTGIGRVGYLQFQDQNRFNKLCGHEDITLNSGTGNNCLTCSLESDVWLADHDIVLAYNGNYHVQASCSFMAPNKVALTNISCSQHFKYLKSMFAADWKWADSEPKGNFVTKDYSFNFRDIGEYNRLVAASASMGGTYGCDSGGGAPLCVNGIVVPPYPTNQSSIDCVTRCLPFSACSPSVICVSPNGEVFKNGITLPLKDFPLDDKYKNLWQMEIQSTMGDPFWKQPPCKCEYVSDFNYACDKIWTEDQGACSNDTLTIAYYPHRPMVEAMCEVPYGAPPLMNPYYIGCRDTNGNNVCVEPQPGVITWNPWTLYLNELACVCAVGRFAADYTANGIVCGEYPI